MGHIAVFAYVLVLLVMRRSMNFTAGVTISLVYIIVLLVIITYGPFVIMFIKYYRSGKHSESMVT